MPISKEAVVFLKSLLHNLGAAAVSFIVAILGWTIGLLFGIPGFLSIFAVVAGFVVFAVGFWLRMWANHMFL